MQAMNNSSFYFKWKSFLLGFILGIFGVIFSLFANEERRDKIYSSLIGCCLGVLTTMILLKYGLVKMP